MTDCLWLLRHGATEWSEHELHTGRAEPPLSAEGREQAALAGRWLEGRRFAHVIVSPQVRARETCRLAGFGSEAAVWDDLVEWDYGDLEGQTDEDTDECRPGWNLFRDGAPGGESPVQMAARVQRALERLDQMAGPCLLVGHGKHLRALAALWLDQGIEFGASLPMDPATVSVLEREDGTPLARVWNFRGRLPG